MNNLSASIPFALQKPTTEEGLRSPFLALNNATTPNLRYVNKNGAGRGAGGWGLGAGEEEGDRDK